MFMRQKSIRYSQDGKVKPSALAVICWTLIYMLACIWSETDLKRTERSRCRLTSVWRSLRRSKVRAFTNPWQRRQVRRPWLAVRWGRWYSDDSLINRMLTMVAGTFIFFKNILIRQTWWLIPPRHLTPFVLFYRSRSKTTRNYETIVFPLFYQFSLQPDINMKIQALLNDYLDSHFRPAWRNMKTNLGKTGLVEIIF